MEIDEVSQDIYKLYGKIRNENVEKMIEEYEKSPDIEKTLHSNLKKLLMKISSVEICIDIIKTTVYLILINKNTQKNDKKIANKLFKSFRKMQKLDRNIIQELYNVTKILQLLKSHNR